MINSAASPPSFIFSITSHLYAHSQQELHSSVSERWTPTSRPLRKLDLIPNVWTLSGKHLRDHPQIMHCVTIIVHIILFWSLSFWWTRHVDSIKKTVMPIYILGKSYIYVIYIFPRYNFSWTNMFSTHFISLSKRCCCSTGAVMYWQFCYFE